MKKLFISLLLPILILLISAGRPDKASGVQPPVLQVLDGSLGQLNKDSFNIVSDTLFFDPSYNSVLDKHYLVRNTVRLHINPYSPFFLKRSFSATLRLEITKTDANGAVTSFDTSLTVRYNKDSLIRDRDSYLFSNAYRVKVKVIDRQTDADWDVWKSLTLENELQSFPVFSFDCSKDTINSVNHAALDSNSTADELPVSWTQVTGADQYDLEWTYIDSSALKGARQLYGSPANPNAALIFDNSCTRVTITGTSYNIPLLYDGTGTLFFRVRPVQLQAGGGRTEGHWSSDHQAPGGFYFKGHQRNLNWQSTATFAEEGKRKVVVQYYDGSLRGRQTVTKDNTTNTTVVSESFYDYQGRPVIQVLPSPTFNNVIKYSQNFNLGLNGSAYDKNDFDSLADPSQYCNSGAKAMGTGSGASQYYSTANPDRDTGISKYIPDAAGYPFTEVEYVQDNTGRISRQSGVGPRHQLGSGHETKYFYGTPDQHELDALFGTEVGDYSHYFKTMVRDANGQFSVSYTDMHGRTIATALAGVPDSTKLDTLSSYRQQRITETLSTPSSNVVKDLVMESKKGLVVAVPGVNQFSYVLNPASLQLPDCNNNTVCYDCLYDLEITITSDCNNQKVGGQPFDTVIHNFSLSGRPDTTCGKPADSFAVSFSKYLDAGSYEITKRLSVSRYGEDYYRDSVYMKRNSCRNMNSFLQEQRAIQASMTQCTPSCQSCTDSLGDWSTYYSRYIARAGIAANDSSYKDMILSAYQEAQASCNLLCDKITDAEDIRQAMLLDMTPPSGQYANPDSASDRYSIFFVHKNSNGDQTDTTEPVYTRNNNYLDENGNPDLVYDETTDRMVQPQDLTPEAFAQKFKLPWAEALLQYHPEYKKLQEYENLDASNAWDKRFEAVDTYEQAMQKGYLNPTGNPNAPYNRHNAQGLADYDPAAGVGYMSSLNDSLKNYIIRTGLGYPRPTETVYMTLWDLATASIRCAGKDASCMLLYRFNPSTNHDDSAFNSNMCTGDLDMAWRTFRQAYLDIKRKLINAHLKTIPSIPSAGTLLAAHHQPHFTDADELVQATGLTPPSDQSSASQQSQTAINDYYDATCKAYVTMWWQNLQKPCNYDATDSAAIIPLLIQVCKEGSDVSHPYGASSISPNSSYQYKSFEDVIDQYNAGKSKPATCNAYGIKAPQPYDQQLAYNNKPLWTGPDSCECDHIQSIYRNYQAVSGHYLSFSDYVYKAYQTSMADSTLTQLLNMCTATPGTVGCNYLATPIQLPPVMQCSTGDICVGCTQFKALDAEFRNKYPLVSPVAAPSPTDSTQLAANQLYEQFMNYRLGFTKSTADYLSFFNSCNGKGGGTSTTYDTATISCAGMDSLIKEYKGIYLQPFTGYADLDMRTFAGNITPVDGPKGVFDINGLLLGNTANGTTDQVNVSFAQIWNSSSVNQQVGTLSSLPNGKFRLKLKPGQLVPKNGIIGMRYYQFDIPYDTLDAVLTNLGSYVDFGDGQHIRVDSVYTSSLTTIGIDYQGFGTDWAAYYHVTHVYSGAAARTVTVYHSDIYGILGFDTYLPGTGHGKYLVGLQHLRGYAPQDVKYIKFYSTQDPTLNTFSGLANKDQFGGVQWISFASGDGGVTRFKNYNFGSLQRFHTLTDFDAHDTLYPGINSVLPNLPVNFPLLRTVFLGIPSFSDSLDFSLPKLNGAFITGLSTSQVDRILNQVAASTTVDTGGGALMGAPRSAASNTAVAQLTARTWAIVTQAESINPNNWLLKGFDTADWQKHYPDGSAFTDFINAKFGTSMEWTQLNDFYKRKCGKLPDLTTPDTVASVPPVSDTCKKFSFIKTYGGSGQEQANDFVQLSDGGYLIGGQTTSSASGNWDGFVMRVDKKGAVLWSKRYGDSGSDTIMRVRLTRDGHFIALANSSSFGNVHGAPWLIKADLATGAIDWTRNVDQEADSCIHAGDVIQTSDGGFVVAVTRSFRPSTADWELIRLDSAGNTLWARTYGDNPGTDIMGGILEDNGSLIVTGYTQDGNSFYDGLIMKINKSNGDTVWSKSFDISIGDTLLSNWMGYIYNTPDGYLINSVATTNYTPSSTENIRSIIVATDKDGNVTRTRSISRPPGSTATGDPALFPTFDGGTISIQGERNTNADIYWHKRTSNGTITWNNRTALDGDQHINAVLQNADGSFAAVGYSDSHVLLLRVDSLGNTGCADSSVSFSNIVPDFIMNDLTLGNIVSINPGNYLRTIPAVDGFITVGNICVKNSCQTTVTDTLFLCGRAEPVLPPAEVNTINNCTDSTFFAVSKSTELFNVYTDSIQTRFDSMYRARCMQAYLYEHFTVTHHVSEYHHTLYYYDQAGNLLKTVPPVGVQANYDSVWLDNVAAARAADQSLVPAHGLNTQYRYNTLNQVVAQQTPDAGQSHFWYDRLGRLAISQNARQKYVSSTEQGKQYSYTLYDGIGRITEVGQIANAGTTPMTDSISRVESNLLAWITASQGNKEQITQTVYDISYTGFTGISFTPIVQRNLRNRVAYTSFTNGSNPAQYNQGTFYTYDPEGNVDTLLQDYGNSLFGPVQNVMNLNGNRFKRLVYQYDLVSGKVNNVAYQPHQVDAFYHRYTYDAENRLTLAETSTDSVYWDKEARYEYYKHGPLARVILGDKMVQGLDYAYTLQGWLKGVNSTSLLPLYDMGRDGDTTAQNRYIAKDVYGFGLNYFTGDYTAIGTNITPFPGSSGLLDQAYRPLFNGNISSMAVNLGPLYHHSNGVTDTSHWRGPLLYNYRYDQLNRITGMDAYYGLNQALNMWGPYIYQTPDFRERVAYDGNGNIQQYKRNNFGETGLPMDSLGYKYITGTNKLLRIQDSADDAIGGGYDLHNQPANNYAYDSIGNLIKDSSERISNIKWNVYGKIIEIDHRTTTPANPTKNIYYYYDAAGHRIGKKVTRGDTSAVSYTWYVRDASGNVMSTYSTSIDSAKALDSANLQLNEQHIYGSSRLGILTANRSADANTEGLNNYVSPWTGMHLPYYTGKKQYELTNHLGNVLATISDKKIGVSLAQDSSLIDHYEADVQTAQDYYPFGMIMPGRMMATLSIPGGTFSGTTQVNGYTLPTDLTLTSRAGNQPTSYVASDLIDLNEGFESGDNDDVTAYIADGSYAGGGNGSNDAGIAGGGKYRYGFNGKENDNEVKGIGDQIDYGMRVYDPRAGRFLSTDPITRNYPQLTPYQYASNNPVQNIDIDGKEGMAGNLCVPGKWHIPGDANDDGIVTPEERRLAGKLYFALAKVTAFTLLARRPDIAIPLLVTDISGAPVVPSPQAYGESMAAQEAAQTEEFLEETSGVKATPTTGTAAPDMQKPSVGTSIRNTNTQVKNANGDLAAADANTADVSTSGNGGSRANTGEPTLKQKRAATLASNNANSKPSEEIVFKRLESQLGDDDAILRKPRIYIGDGTSGKYATPDFAIYNKKTGEITKIVDAKNGGGGLSERQEELNQQGGVFRGSSRAKQAKPQKIEPGKVEIERTEVEN